MAFIDHPDGYISLNEAVYPLDFWGVVEPAYSLAERAIYVNGVLQSGTYVGREFVPGVRHHLIRHSTGSQEQADINDAALVMICSRAATYASAYSSWQDGAYVANVGGEIVVQGPPVVTSDKAEIQDDGLEAATITANVGDAAYQGALTWKVTGPEAAEVADTCVNGVATLQFTSNLIGIYRIEAVTALYGKSSIGIEVI